MSTEIFPLEPLNTKLVVKRATVDHISEFGILMPDSVTSKELNEGEVLAVGKGKKLDDGTRVPMDVSLGDLVVFGDYSGSDITRGEDKFCILDEVDILAILHE